jgi:hypothetical protein
MVLLTPTRIALRMLTIRIEHFKTLCRPMAHAHMLSRDSLLPKKNESRCDQLPRSVTYESNSVSSTGTTFDSD